VPLGATTALSATAADGIYALRLFALNACGASAGTDTMLGVGAAAIAAVAAGDGSSGSASSAASAAGLPGAPENLAATVSDQTVTVTWAPPVTGGTPTRYIIEAMTAGGPVGLDTGNAGTIFVHPNTPAGSYVVRVRAGNAAGIGPLSQSITVVVP
jgi:hypothetical protein